MTKARFQNLILYIRKIFFNIKQEVHMVGNTLPGTNIFIFVIEYRLKQQPLNISSGFFNGFNQQLQCHL